MVLSRPARPPAPSTWERLGAVGPRVVDVGLLLGVGWLVALEVLVAGNGRSTSTWVRLLVSATGLLAVATRRRMPVLTMLGLAGVLAVVGVYRDPVIERMIPYAVFAPVAALGAVATPVVRRQAMPIAVAASAAGAVAVALLLLLGPSRGPEVRLLLIVLLGGTYVIGVGAGVYLRYLDRRQGVAAEAARLDERMELARELHDLVAHHLTGIVVQAQAAQVVADRDPDAAGHAVVEIEQAGREALTAMRHLVGALRNQAAGAAAPTTPPVGLAGLHDLAAGVHAGMAVRVIVEPAAEAQVAGAVAASVHRIVQESLTNVRRHATRATRAEVVVRLRGAALLLTVTDDGVPAAPSTGTPTERGFGLLGMAERAEALGGTLRAGRLPPPAHGWRVEALLPLDVPAGSLR